MNLDEIEIRVGRGQYLESDVQALLSVAKNPDGAVLDRIGKGFRNMIDVAYLFSLVSGQAGRKSAAERAAADAASTQEAISNAQAVRDALAAKALADQAKADADRAATAQAVASERALEAQQKADHDRQQANLTATEKILADKEKVSSSLFQQLGTNVQTTPPVVGPQDSQTN